MKLYIFYLPSGIINYHTAIAWWGFLLFIADVVDIFSSLDIREHIVLQILELRLLLGFL